MPTERYALVTMQGEVENIILLDPDSDWTPPEDRLLVRCGEVPFELSSPKLNESWRVRRLRKKADRIASKLTKLS